MVKAMVAVVRRGDSADEEAGVSLSTVLPGGSLGESDAEETPAGSRVLDIVKTKYLDGGVKEGEKSGCRRGRRCL
jgi:hypothetical protein